MRIGQFAIVVTVVGWAVFVVLTLTRTSIGGSHARPPLGLATIGYLVIMTLLACSAGPARLHAACTIAAIPVVDSPL